MRAVDARLLSISPASRYETAMWARRIVCSVKRATRACNGSCLCDMSRAVRARHSRLCKCSRSGKCTRGYEKRDAGDGSGWKLLHDSFWHWQSPPCLRFRRRRTLSLPAVSFTRISPRRSHHCTKSYNRVVVEVLSACQEPKYLYQHNRGSRQNGFGPTWSATSSR